jgi:hypothetical protein
MEGPSEGIGDQPGRPTALDHEKLGGKHATKFVANAALSQATAIQKPSLFTKNMFLVCLTSHANVKYVRNPTSI